jgi:GntR family transcriptional regulator, transcriptional repressor for pyruvate dehydrogenase complex
MIKSRPSEAARRIRQYIIHHGLKPGDQLPTHDELSRVLEVGRLRLREGLSILRDQGIIETRNKGGTIVRRPIFKTQSEPIAWHLDTAGYQLEDLVSARAWLESGVAAVAAEKRTARDLLVILDALEQLQAAAISMKNDVAEEEAFHLAIMQATHNAVMLTFGQLVRWQFQDKDAPPESPDYRQRANQEHRAIYEAIERQDRMAARDLMYAHVMGQLKPYSSKDDNTC